MGIKLDPESLVKQGAENGIQLGDLAKRVRRWTVGLGWKPGATSDVDCDLWMVALRNGVAVELVRYNEKDSEATVVSPSGALTYCGDDRTGGSSEDGDDETGIIDLDLVVQLGADRVLIIANIYKPADLTFEQVQDAYVRIFPENDESEAVAIKLTEKGVGVRTVIFGWLELEQAADGERDWKFVNEPRSAKGIKEALAPFGVS